MSREFGMSKGQVKRAAKNWLRMMRESNKDEIDAAIRNTVVFSRGEFKLPEYRKRFDNTEIEIYPGSSTEALFKEAISGNERICVLNFASHIIPGGMFLSGEYTQEESICHNSVMYDVLTCDKCKTYYNDKHWETDDSGFIYTCKCLFPYGDDNYHCDVITMAAYDNNKGNDDFAKEIMKKKQEIAFLAPSCYGATTIILGAWGCGIFKNDLNEVASTWKELQDKYDGLYEKVIHPAVSQKTGDVFRSIMEI